MAREGNLHGPHWYKPSGNPFVVQWPLPEDLTYTNDTLLTAGSDGLPVGDLNWYPDKKAEWEAMQTGVEETLEDFVSP